MQTFKEFMRLVEDVPTTTPAPISPTTTGAVQPQQNKPDPKKQQLVQQAKQAMQQVQSTKGRQVPPAQQKTNLDNLNKIQGQLSDLDIKTSMDNINKMLADVGGKTGPQAQAGPLGAVANNQQTPPANPMI